MLSNTGLNLLVCLQVEIKLRLPDEAAHAKVQEALAPAFRETHEQENFFFDAPDGRLGKQLTTLRVRFYGVDKKAVVNSKVYSHRPPIFLDLKMD